MSLAGLQAASTPSPVNPTSSPTSVPEPSISSSSSSSGLSQNQAAQLVGNWLGSKSKIFAPPFNRQLVNQYTTGQLYKDITKPNGSINWLEKIILVTITKIPVLLKLSLFLIQEFNLLSLFVCMNIEHFMAIMGLIITYRVHQRGIILISSQKKMEIGKFTTIKKQNNAIKNTST